MAFPADVAVVQADIVTDITSKTLPNSITPTDVGSNMDDICLLLLELYGLVVTAGDLQSVLNTGSTASRATGTGNISLTNSPTDSSELALTDFQLVFINSAGQTSIGMFNTSTPLLTMYRGGVMRFWNTGVTFYSQIVPNSFTANRGVLLPDEGNGTGIASTLVTHLTKDDIAVTPDGGLHQGTYANNICRIHDASAEAVMRTTDITLADASGNFISMQVNATVPTLAIRMSGAAWEADFIAGTLSTHRTYSTPNRSGLLQLSGDGVNPTYTLSAGAGTGATLAFSATSDDRSGTVTLVTGTGCTTSAVVCTIIYHQAYASVTRVCISAANANGIVMINSRCFIGGENVNNFAIDSGGVALSDSTTYIFKYIVQN